MNSAILRSLLALAFGICSACAIEPTPRPDPGRFAGEIAAIAKKEPQKGGIVFTGSSSIRLWSHLKEDFSGLPVVNCGFGGCVSNDMVVYFDTVVARQEPKLLVTYCGSNDIEEKLTVQEAFDDYTKFLKMTHDRFPKTRVILTSVKIAPRRAAQIPRVNELNCRLEAWCSGKDWLRYLDCTSYLADPADQPIPTYFRDDHLHLNAEGYSKWKSILEPVVREEWEKVN
jgi:lysophospholipase L1-like esterase